MRIRLPKLLECALQLGKPEFSAKYEEALAQAGPDQTLDGVLREMAGGANPMLEVADYEQGGKDRLMVLEIMEAKLTRCVPGPLSDVHAYCGIGMDSRLQNYFGIICVYLCVLRSNLVQGTPTLGILNH